MLRRTLSNRIEYFAIGVTGRTQDFAQGDKFPTLDNTRVGVVSASGQAAAITGNPNNVLYDSESIFDLRATSKADKAHYRFMNGVDHWKVVPLNPEESERCATALKEFFSGNDVEKLFWDKLFKDFPSLKTPFTDTLKSEYTNYFQQVVSVADDEAAVAALAEPFLVRQWAENFMDTATTWRIVEKLSIAVELHMNKSNRYEKRAVRETLERVTKIGLNTLASQPWVHESATNPMTLNVGGCREWHEAGLW